MTSRNVSLVIALAGTLAMGACAGAPEMNAPADISAVNAIRASFQTAFNAGDAEGIGNLYTDDAVSQSNHRPTDHGKAAIIASNRATFAQMSFRVDITPDETKTVGNLGMDRGTYRMTITPKAGGAPMNDEGRYIVLLAKGTDGKWKVTLDMDNSTMPMPPPAAPAPAKPPAKGKGRGK